MTNHRTAMSATHPTGEELASLLVRHGIVSAHATNDPEGYDGGMMLDNINKAARELRGEQRVNPCPCSFPHPPHDYCDGFPDSTRKTPTFTAHGLTWIRHTPGDPMPCDGQEDLRILCRNEHSQSGKAQYFHWGTRIAGDCQIIGWNYADSSKEVKG